MKMLVTHFKSCRNDDRHVMCCMASVVFFTYRNIKSWCTGNIERFVQLKAYLIGN